MSVKEDSSVTSVCFQPHQFSRCRELRCIVLPDVINLWAIHWFVYWAQAVTLPPVPTFVRLSQFWWDISTAFKPGQLYAKVCLELLPDPAQWHHPQPCTTMCNSMNHSFIPEEKSFVVAPLPKQTFNKGWATDCRLSNRYTDSKDTVNSAVQGHNVVNQSPTFQNVKPNLCTELPSLHMPMTSLYECATLKIQVKNHVEFGRWKCSKYTKGSQNSRKEGNLHKPTWRLPWMICNY